MRSQSVVGSILLLSLLGCGGASGPERCSVSGEVSFEGEIVASGLITFIPESGKGPSAGGAIKAGRYEIAADAGPGVGSHRVEIIGLKSEGTKAVEGVQGHTGGPSGSGTVEELKMFIPDEFNKKSSLKVEIKSGKNQHNFPLKRS